MKDWVKWYSDTVREKCSVTEFFLLQMRENTDQKNICIWKLFSRNAVVGRCSVNKIFFKISWNPQEYTCVWDSCAFLRIFAKSLRIPIFIEHLQWLPLGIFKETVGYLLKIFRNFWFSTFAPCTLLCGW